MKNFFTADSHFNHTKILKYCNRPFNNVEEMNAVIINNLNSVVGKKDNIWHLGDFAFGKDVNELKKIFNRLNGNKFLILGNHDKVNLMSQLDWKSIEIFKEISVGGNPIILMHYAMRVWPASHFGSWQLYGHSHGQLLDDPNLLSWDVGVDNNNFYPVSYDRIKEIMFSKKLIK
jgi:calcineurin-like phosphoesterase family protein